ncbi:MAG TPA: folylpolyglutamate synthase/dihydrofolate synthase family protein [Verrucomicrobiae bacterium]|nr:folylpolyglutamate synthase/dihydrofolate synthase family protein [Verrucomicrobiae bacterium]
MTYSEAIQFLYSLRLFGAKFGLENTFRLVALAGNPQEKLRFIHVAGTNGKGSTCAMLESIYRAAGLRIGLFTSPHLVSFRERIQVNRQLISEKDVMRLVEKLRGLQSRAGFQPAPDRQDACPTFFEFVTVMALKFFAEQKCDLVIWETGLGGRLDATNIVTPLASVITNISFDHQQWLGEALEKIAFEKAGIIKPQIPVVTAVDGPEASAVIEKVAREKNAPLTKVGQVSSPSPFEKSKTGKMPVLRLLGEHQKQNAALALEVVDVLQKQIPVSQKQIEAGLKNVNWQGRLQLIEKNGQKILLDGAHNVAGAKVLREAIENREGWRAAVPDKFRSPTRRPSQITLILGILQDKDWRRICEILAPLAEQIFCAPVASERAANPDELAEACRQINPRAEIFACSSLAEAMQKISAENFIIVTGSLYLVGEALEILGLSPAGESERALNEWGTKPEILK